MNLPSAVSIQVPFSSLQGGSPVFSLDPSTLSNVQWQLQGSNGACQAKLTITAVAFY